jgi:branched-chain amino acid transport system permease protein
MIIIGGMGNVTGVIVGALVLYMVNSYAFPKLTGVAHSLHLNIDFTAIQFGVFGFFLLLMMVLRPQGMIPSRRRALELTHGELVEDTSLFEARQ